MQDPCSPLQEDYCNSGALLPVLCKPVSLQRSNLAETITDSLTSKGGTSQGKMSKINAKRSLYLKDVQRSAGCCDESLFGACIKRHYALTTPCMCVHSSHADMHNTFYAKSWNLTKEASCHGGFCNAQRIDGRLLCSPKKFPNNAMHIWASEQSHQRKRWRS